MDLTDEARSEITAAIKILKEDGAHIHKTYAAFLKSQETTPVEPATESPIEGGPPPVKETETETPAKRGLWWGDRA